MKLKPCPFCGGGADLLEEDPRQLATLVQCTECGASIPASTNEDDAIRRWNTRTTFAPTVAERLEKRHANGFRP
ncbi:MAG TPA: Lar family restriction alleviation protein [Myxococcota bacterium]|nr:Lar family restriction alleviation protein [Myxococcota bacterium]